MKKNVLIIMVIIVIIFVLGLGIIYSIDMYQIRHNKPVIFSTWGYDYVPPVGISNDYDLRYDTSFVIKHDNIINVNLLDDFIKNSNLYSANRKSCTLRILSTTIEGDYIVKDIEYNKEKNQYIVTIDNSRDTFSNNEQKAKKDINTYSGEIYNIVKKEENNIIKVELVSNKSSETLMKEIPICSYSKDLNQKSIFQFIGTILEETNNGIVVKPNDDEDEIKSSDKFYIKTEENKDYSFGIGRKVLITYTGYIKETYPAQIDAIDINTEGYSDFEIIVKPSKNAKNIKILNNQDLYDLNSKYNLYYYGLDEVNIEVDNKVISLEEALRSGKITINGILSKANNDVKKTEEMYSNLEEHQSVPKLFPYSDIYKDGGSIIFYYETYTILKNHTLDGNRDVYIGIPEMNIDIRNI